MVASLENTVRKWRAVRRALLRGGRQTGASWALQPKNAPTFTSIRNNYWTAFNNANNVNDANEGHVRAWFTQNPGKRQHITVAYNKLNNVHRELNAVAHKIMAIRTLQRRWRAARPAVMNKRKAAALLTLGQLTAPNMRRAIFKLAYPKPVYGPMTQQNTWLRTMTRRYPTY